VFLPLLTIKVFVHYQKIIVQGFFTRRKKMTAIAEKAELVLDGLDRVGEVARFLKLSVSTVYGFMDRGELPYVKFGKARRIPHRAVVELAAASLVSRDAD
jgi:excisionase family DNA binding protein